MCSGGFGLCPPSREPDRRAPGQRREGSDLRVEQRGRGRLGAGATPPDAPDPKDGFPRTSARTPRSSGSPLRELEVELVPRGPGRSGSARAAPDRRLLHDDGVARWWPMGKETRAIGGREYVARDADPRRFRLRARASRRPHLGNLVYRMSARNFNPMAATAGRRPREVEQLCRAGRHRSGPVVTPGFSSTNIVRGRMDPSESKRERIVGERRSSLRTGYP